MYSKHEIYYLLLVDSVVIVSRRGVKWSTTYELRTETISKCYIVIYVMQVYYIYSTTKDNAEIVGSVITSEMIFLRGVGTTSLQFTRAENADLPSSRENRFVTHR